MGLDYSIFWRLTFREIHLIMRGKLAAQKRDRARDFDQAMLMALAVNDPKNLPKRDQWLGIKKPKPRDDPAGLHAMLMAMAKKGGG